MTASDIKSNPEFLHRKMLVSLDKEIAKGTIDYDRFACMVGVLLQPGDIASCRGTIDLLQKFETTGEIGVGMYEVLKDLLAGAGLATARDVVLKSEGAIKKALRCFDDSKEERKSPSKDKADRTVVRGETEETNKYAEKESIDVQGEKTLIMTNASKEDKEARCEYYLLRVRLHRQLPPGSDDYACFKHLCKAYLGESVESCNSALELLSALDNMNWLDVGKYAVLRKLLREDIFPKLLEILEKHESDLKEIHSTDVAKLQTSHCSFKINENGNVMARFQGKLFEYGATDMEITNEDKAKNELGRILDSQRGCRVTKIQNGCFIADIEISSLEGFLCLWIQYIDRTLENSCQAAVSEVILALKLEMTEQDCCKAITHLAGKFLFQATLIKVQECEVLFSTMLGLMRFGNFERLSHTIDQLRLIMDSRVNFPSKYLSATEEGSEVLTRSEDYLAAQDSATASTFSCSGESQPSLHIHHARSGQSTSGPSRAASDPGLSARCGHSSAGLSRATSDPGIPARCGHSSARLSRATSDLGLTGRNNSPAPPPECQGNTKAFVVIAGESMPCSRVSYVNDTSTTVHNDIGITVHHCTGSTMQCGICTSVQRGICITVQHGTCTTVQHNTYATTGKSTTSYTRKHHKVQLYTRPDTFTTVSFGKTSKIPVFNCPCCQLRHPSQLPQACPGNIERQQLNDENKIPPLVQHLQLHRARSRLQDIL